MARINVNPTRIELKRLKARLKTAERGHKLLKDKTDEMVRRFSVKLKENKVLREQVERDVISLQSQFLLARSLMKKEEIKLAFSMPAVSFNLECGTDYVMNLAVPKLELEADHGVSPYPYSFLGTTSEADYSVKLVGDVLGKLIKLSEVEKTIQMMAEDIEKSKRRVNALEHVMIPNLEETIKYISMKLEENERSSRTRLMKVKSMIEERNKTC